MRQLVGLVRVINRAKATDYYYQTLVYAQVHGVKMPTLEEYLGLSFKDEGQPAFDPETDKRLEALAQKSLELRKARHGRQRTPDKN